MTSLSVVIPIKDERDNLRPLHERLRRTLDPLAEWPEYICNEQIPFVRIGNETYKMDQDGNLMPTRNQQPPPDLRYFRQPKK